MRPIFLAAVVASTLACTGTASATVILFNDFSSAAGLTLNGNAALAVDGSARNVLRVTPATFSQAGSAFSTAAVSLDLNASFSTKFSFNINTPGGASDNDGLGADGIVFVVQTVANNVGTGGGGIGYLGIPNSVGVEFDTWNNGPGFGDPNGNHIAIDVGGAFTSSPVGVVANRMNDGQDHFVWIDYNGATGQLEVRFSLFDSRPAAPFISGIFDLPTLLGSNNAFVGFTSGTGAAFGNHDILAWEFRSTFDPIDDGQIPEPMSVALLGAGLLGLGVARRRRRQLP